MTLLSIIQDSADTLGIPRPTAVISSVDLNVRRLLACAQREGIALHRRYLWEATVRETTHVSLAQENQGAIATIAPGFDAIVNETAFNRTRQEALVGPLNPTQWQARKASVVSGPTIFFRIRDGSLLASPTPSAGDTWAFEYYSKYFCQSSGGTDQVRWAADNDTGILDEEIMTLGTIWRFKQSNGLDYSEDFQSYETMVTVQMAKDGGKPRLYMGDDSGGQPFTPGVPEGSWNL